MKFVAFSGVLHNAGIGLAEHRLVETFAKALGRFCHLFIDFLIEFGNLVLDEHVGPVALLGVTVVDQGIIESVDMPRSFPDGRVHEDRGVYAHDVVVKHGHRFPPVALDVVLQFDTVLTVVVHCRQAVVDLA